MDHLDEKIDSLIRGKLVSLMQENVVRIKRTRVKYTKGNKKHTLEHWQAIFDSYAKLFRNIPREITRVEREVRIKFVSPMTSERVNRLKTMINAEAETLIQSWTDECRPPFEHLGHVDIFEQKLKEIRPVTLGQAARISGVTPSSITLLIVLLEQRFRTQGKNGNGKTIKEPEQANEKLTGV